MNTLQLLQSMENDWLENEFRRSTQVMRRTHGSAVCRILGKHLIEIDPDDIGCSTHLAMNGYWEMPVTRAITKHVQPGSNCIDVGANVGYYTVLLAAVMGCQVMAMEPQRRIHRLLSCTLPMNGIGKQVVLSNEAAGDEAGEVYLEQADDQTANAMIVEIVVDSEATRTVPTVRIDDQTIFSKKDVRFVKIDAEGYEPKIIDGMRDTIIASADLQVCMEFSAPLYEDREGFLSMLSDLFVCRQINDDGSLRDMDRADVIGAEEFEMLWLVGK